MQNNYLDSINNYRNCRATAFNRLKRFFNQKGILERMLREINYNPLFDGLDMRQRAGLKAEVIFFYRYSKSIPALDYGDKTDFMYKNIHIDVTSNASFKHDSEYFEFAMDADYVIAQVDIDTHKISFRRVADTLECPNCESDSMHNILTLYNDQRVYGLYSNYQQVDGYCLECSEYVEQIEFFSYHIFSEIERRDALDVIKLFSTEYEGLISGIALSTQEVIDPFDGESLDVVNLLHSHPFRGKDLPSQLR